MTEQLFVPDANLASPNNSVYKTVLEARSWMAAAAGTSGTYFLGSQLVPANLSPMLSGATYAPTVIAVVPQLIDFDDADYTVGGLTQKLRLRAIVATNATAPGITFTFGLYPVTVLGAGTDMRYTAGTVVASSTLAMATPSASTPTRGTPTADFTIPSDGAFALGVATSGTLASSSFVSMHAILQTRNV